MSRERGVQLRRTGHQGQQTPVPGAVSQPLLRGLLATGLERAARRCARRGRSREPEGDRSAVAFMAS